MSLSKFAKKSASPLKSGRSLVGFPAKVAQSSTSAGCSKKRSENADDEQERQQYFVEAVLDKKHIGAKKYYYVKWVGYDDPTWEKAENCRGCKKLVLEFERQRKAERVLGVSLKPSTTTAQKASLGNEENENAGAHGKRFKVERGAEVVEVLASYVRTNDDGSRKVFAKVKYDDNSTEVLPTVILMRQCPTKLIDYYESRLKFE
ncbi:chromobox-like 1 [Aphelenchoides avenae]|nr:chromobox-like 1 [Aphelenchus avenae]